MTHPPQDKFSHVPFGPQRCRNVGGRVLDTLETLLRATAERNGGTLDMRDVERAIAGVRAAPRGLWSFYRESFAGCFCAAHAISPIGYERHDLFIRLMTLTFESRFPDHVGPDDDGPILSRTIIQPFAAALEMMVGQDDLTAHHAACDEIYHELLRLHGDHMTWAAYYDADRSRDVLSAVCSAVARYFSDFDARKTWFIDVLNRNKNRAAAPAPAAEESGEFTETDFAMLFTCLLARCRKATADGAVLALADRIDAYGLGRYLHRDPG